MALSMGYRQVMGMECTECGQLIGCDDSEKPASQTEVNLARPGWLRTDQDYDVYRCPKCGQLVVREKR